MNWQNRGGNKVKATVKVNVTPKEYGVIKEALNNYIVRLDNLEQKELGYDMDRKIAKERRIIASMQKDLGIEE